MSAHSNLVHHVEEVLAIAASYGAANVRVFGSIARRDDDLSSDVDLLVALEPGRTLFDVGGLAFDLAELLGCPVDVVTEGGLQGRFREYVLRDAVPLERLAA